MQITQQKKILKQIVDLESDITELKRCRLEIAKNGYASASMSSGGGSKSYTRLDLSKITELLVQMTNELKSLKALVNGKSPATPTQILVVYS